MGSLYQFAWSKQTADVSLLSLPPRGRLFARGV
jgi:hypothetical protein